VEQVSWHSAAILDIASSLPWPWRALTLFRWIPAPIRDLAYRAFARIRYRVFGRYDQCKIPTESEAARMLA